ARLSGSSEWDSANHDLGAGDGGGILGAFDGSAGAKRLAKPLRNRAGAVCLTRAKNDGFTGASPARSQAGSLRPGAAYDCDHTHELALCEAERVADIGVEGCFTG